MSSTSQRKVLGDIKTDIHIDIDKVAESLSRGIRIRRKAAKIYLTNVLGSSPCYRWGDAE